MKKLILSAAIVLGSFSSIAQATPDTAKELKEVTVAETKVSETKDATQSEEYTIVKAEEVPAALNVALEASYPGSKIVLAHVNEAKEYKLEIAVEDRKATVYADAEGNWIQK